MLTHNLFVAKTLTAKLKKVKVLYDLLFTIYWFPIYSEAEKREIKRGVKGERKKEPR